MQPYPIEGLYEQDENAVRAAMDGKALRELNHMREMIALGWLDDDTEEHDVTAVLPVLTGHINCRRHYARYVLWEVLGALVSGNTI